MLVVGISPLSASADIIALIADLTPPSPLSP
jgi:hypothetical protein